MYNSDRQGCPVLRATAPVDFRMSCEARVSLGTTLPTHDSLTNLKVKASQNSLREILSQLKVPIECNANDPT